MCHSMFPPIADEPEARAADIGDEDLALLLAVIWIWHDPLPVANAA